MQIKNAHLSKFHIYSCFIDEECPKISLAEMLDDLDIGQEDATGEEGGEMLE